MAAVILLTWLYNNTRGSLLLAWMFHASMNTWSEILPFPSDGPHFWMLVGVQCLVAAVVVALFGPHRLSRLPENQMPFTRGSEAAVQGRPDLAPGAPGEKAA